MGKDEGSTRNELQIFITYLFQSKPQRVPSRRVSVVWELSSSSHKVTLAFVQLCPRWDLSCTREGARSVRGRVCSAVCAAEVYTHFCA